MAVGSLSLAALALALGAGILAAAGGGAVGGLIRARRALGVQVAAVMGLLYGVLGGTIGVIAGLAAIWLTR